MSKNKIQLASVDLKANAEVIVLNTSFVARTVRAAEGLKSIKRRIEDVATKTVEDENGKAVKEFQLGRSDCFLSPVETAVLYRAVIPFIEDLCDALLGEEGVSLNP